MKRFPFHRPRRAVRKPRVGYPKIGRIVPLNGPIGAKKVHWLTTDQGARLTFVSASSLRQMRRKNGGPARYEWSNIIRYKAADIDAWTESRRIDPCNASTKQGCICPKCKKSH